MQRAMPCTRPMRTTTLARRLTGSLAATLLALAACGPVDAPVEGTVGVDPLSLPTIRICGSSPPSTASLRAAAELADPVFVNHLTPGGSGRIDSFRYWSGDGSADARWYLAQAVPDDPAALLIAVYAATDFGPIAELTVRTASGDELSTAFAVDRNGDVYVGERTTTDGSAALLRFDLDGALVWEQPLGSVVSGAIYAFDGGTADSAEERIGVVVGTGAGDDRRRSNTFATDGTPGADLPIAGSDVHRADGYDGELVSVEDGGVAIYDRTGTTRRFAMTNRIGDGATWAFDVVGADLLADGSIVAASYNAKAIAVFDPTGALLGVVGADRGAGQPLDVVNHASSVEVVGESVYYLAQNPFSAPNSLTSVPVDSLGLLVRSSPIEHLGLGAALDTTAPYNFFVHGTTPQATVIFSDWWQGVADRLRGTYTVRSVGDVTSGIHPDRRSFEVPSDPASYRDGIAAVPLTGLPTTPGYYEVSVTLTRDGRFVGTDCLAFSVGAAQLDLDLGAPQPERSDTRGVELAAQFGQRLYRSSYNLHDCLAGVELADESTHVACPAELIDDVRSAAALADVLGVTYEVQLGTPDHPVTVASLDSGQWQRLVAETAVQLPWVRVWECWNEPNDNTFASIGDYVERALGPCSAALRGVSTDDLVVGGSILGAALPAWEEFVAAGGLEHIDVAATHPYTGHNRSFEEQGLVVPPPYAAAGEIGALQALRAYLDSVGFDGRDLRHRERVLERGPGELLHPGRQARPQADPRGIDRDRPVGELLQRR